MMSGLHPTNIQIDILTFELELIESTTVSADIKSGIDDGGSLLRSFPMIVNSIRPHWVDSRPAKLTICAGTFTVTVAIFRHTFLRGRTKWSSITIPLVDLISAGEVSQYRLEDNHACLCGMCRIRLVLKADSSRYSSSSLGSSLGTWGEAPVVRRLQVVLDDLNRLRHAVPHRAYEIALTLLSSVKNYLYVALSREGQGGVSFNLLQDPLDPQGGASADLLAQISMQLSTAVEALDKCTGANIGSIGDNITHLVTEVTQGAVVLFGWVDTYPGPSYNTLASPNALCQIAGHRFDALQHKLVYTGGSIRIAASNEHIDLPPDSSDGLVQFLYKGALQESLHNLENRHYTPIFQCLRGRQAEQAFTMFEVDLKRTQAKSQADQRDAMRRLMTHLLQHSQRLPEYLLVRNVQTDYIPINGGGFGEIYRGVHVLPEGDRRDVAIKRIRLKPSDEKHRKRMQLYLELLTCCTLRSKHILPVLGIASNLKDLCLISPLKRNGSTHSYLRHLKNRGCSGATLTGLVQNWLLQIASGMAYMHTEKVAHGDLRGTNILVDDDESAMITDFGLAVYLNGDSGNYESTRAGNPQWLAPELSGGMRPTKAGDVYSFAFVCIELFTGEAPYWRPGDESIVNLGDVLRARVANRDLPLRPLQPGDRTKVMTDCMWNIVQDCWSLEPAARPTASVVMRRLEDCSA